MVCNVWKGIIGRIRIRLSPLNQEGRQERTNSGHFSSVVMYSVQPNCLENGVINGRPVTYAVRQCNPYVESNIFSLHDILTILGEFDVLLRSS